MAHFLPSVPHPNTPYSERVTWQALATLDDKWRVFHHRAWQSLRRGRQGDGEADFILVHPANGILVLEVKGGEVVGVDEEGWYTKPHGRQDIERIKNPYEQAIESKYTLLDRLRDLRLNSLPPVGHVVVFPTGDVNADIGLYGGRDITITESDLLRMPDAIQRAVSHWGQRADTTPEDVKRIIELLAPVTEIRTRLRAKVGATEADLLSLTEGQIISIDGLRRHRRLLITGGPGTGKTVIGAHRARVLSEQGLRVLMTCYNQPLAERLSEELAGTAASALTFHALCLKQARLTGRPIPDNPTPDWWQLEAADALVSAAEETDLRFDAIIIDEGQDFAPNWFAALELLLSSPSDGFLVVLADSEQAVYRQDWEVIPGLVEYVLDVNCRSSLQIVKRVAAVFGSELSGLGTEGPPPSFLLAGDTEETFSIVQQAVAQLLDDEYLPPQSITVLCPTRALVDRFRGSAAGSAIFGAPGEAGVGVETIHRFKGLESETVILCIAGLDLSTSAGRMLAYVGLSRARSYLLVVGTKADKRALNW